MGLVSFPRSSRTVKASVWREEPMVLVCAPGHRLAGNERVTPEELSGLEMVAFDSDLEIRHEIDRALAAHNVEVRVVMEFDNTETIKRAVEIDAGISLLPEPTVAREVEAGALVARPLAGMELKRPIGIIQRRGKELGKTARRFMQLLLKQGLSSREIADLEIAEADGTLDSEVHGDSPVTEDAVGVPAGVSAKPVTADAASRAAS
jgi:DNA-binding transcriptional LysR family regulator